MAKASKNNISSKTREQTIKSCTRCNGQPPEGKCVLQGIEVTYCDKVDCMEVIRYNNTNIKKITNKEVAETIEQEVDKNTEFKLKFV